MSIPTILIDHREKHPYTFEGLHWPGYDGCTVAYQFAHLPAGDYSLLGLEHTYAIERKSWADLWKTIVNGQRRTRFERQLATMNDLKHADVVVEETWVQITTLLPPIPNIRANQNPGFIHRHVLRWQDLYPNVLWHFTPGRRNGEYMTFHLLDAVRCDTQDILLQDAP